MPGAGAAASGGSPPALDEPVTVSRQADEAFSRKDYQGAADPYAQLLRLAPEDVDTHSHLGLTLRCLGRSDEALRALNEGVALDPENQRIWLTSGYVTSPLGNKQQASQA